MLCLGTASCLRSCFFFFNDTATTEIYTLSLHDALPICRGDRGHRLPRVHRRPRRRRVVDRKSTRLNSSHTVISYAVFCLKKKKQLKQIIIYHKKKKQTTTTKKNKHTI